MTELPPARGDTAIHCPARAAIRLALFLAAPAAAQEAAPAYISSAACADCHEEAADKWAGSHHALAWTKPGWNTVVADFDGTEFAHHGMLSRFRIGEDGSYHSRIIRRDLRLGDGD